MLYLCKFVTQLKCGRWVAGGREQRQKYMNFPETVRVARNAWVSAEGLKNVDTAKYNTSVV